jgi:Ca-activated chloride channel family protein
MFRFEHIEYLWQLTALVPLVLLFVWFQVWRRKGLKAFGKTSLVQQLTPQVSSGKQVLKFLLLALAYTFMVLGFANPQLGSKQESVKRKGIDVMIAIDVSNSMLSEDVKPSRLARAKYFIGNFIDELHNDRLGMVVFAGQGYLQMPLTVDYSAARMYLKTINPNLVPTQGTDIAAAIRLANQSFVQKDTKHKALIIISDGEDNEGGVDDAIAEAKKMGVRIFTLGVGTDKGGPIPIAGNYKHDENGNVVLSKMNPAMLKEIADKGDGKYFQLGSGREEIAAIFKELGQISTKEFEEMVFTDFDDKYQWCLALAALLLVLEWWLIERKGIL